MPGLNDLLAGKAQMGKWNRYNEQKALWYGQISQLVRTADIPVQGPGMASALWVEPHRQRDPDNVIGGGFKLLLDAFAGCEVIAGDGWKDVLGLIGHWHHVPGRAGCLFHWGDELLGKAQMLELLEKEGKSGIKDEQNGSGLGNAHVARARAKNPRAAGR